MTLTARRIRQLRNRLAREATARIRDVIRSQRRRRALLDALPPLSRLPREIVTVTEYGRDTGVLMTHRLGPSAALHYEPPRTTHPPTAVPTTAQRRAKGA